MKTPSPSTLRPVAQIDSSQVLNVTVITHVDGATKVGPSFIITHGASDLDADMISHFSHFHTPK